MVRCILLFFFFFFFFKQKTAYEMRISDWSSDVCSSDLRSAACSRRISSAIRPTTTSTTATWVRRRCARWSTSWPARRAGKATPWRANGRGCGHGRTSPTTCRPTAATADRLSDRDRKSVVSGERVSVRVALGGPGTINKKKNQEIQQKVHHN